MGLRKSWRKSPSYKVTKGTVVALFNFPPFFVPIYSHKMNQCASIATGNQLERVADGAVLHWRRPGEAVEDPSDGEEDSDVVDLSELTAEQEALER